jgi:suppressor for copper-sensitivity B
MTGQISLGLHVQLKPGWKTYWRNPGEAGAPPVFDWSGSENLADAEILWPAPKRFSAFGYDSFGYEKEIIWPIKLTAKDSGAPVLAKLKVDYLICKNICIPKTASLAIDASADNGAGVENRTLIKYFSDLVPKTGPAAPFRISHIALSGAPGKQQLTVKAASTISFDQPDLMVESQSNFGFGRPVLTLSDDRKEVVLSVPVFDLFSKDRNLAGEQLRLTLVQGSLASEKDVVIAAR